jgi:hypothetical protein
MVGTRSRLIRFSAPDGLVPCAASVNRCTPARPGSRVWNASVDRIAPDAPACGYDQKRRTGCAHRDVLSRFAWERVPTITSVSAAPDARQVSQSLAALSARRRNFGDLRSLQPESGH